MFKSMRRDRKWGPITNDVLWYFVRYQIALRWKMWRFVLTYLFYDCYNHVWLFNVLILFCRIYFLGKDARGLFRANLLTIIRGTWHSSPTRMLKRPTGFYVKRFENFRSVVIKACIVPLSKLIQSKCLPMILMIHQIHRYI